MARKLCGIMVVLLAVVFVFTVMSMGGMIIPANDNAKENARAPEKSPVITDNWGLERIDFIHYAKGSGSGTKPTTQTCYKLLGSAWKNLPVSYIINPVNALQPDLAESLVTGAIAQAAETWDTSAVTRELMNDLYTVDNTAQYGVQDYKNVIAFGNYPTANVIAVTSIWITRRPTRQIVEFDMLLDTDFTWGDAIINPAVMDLQNIVTHELGHAIGLDDIYDNSCNTVTMYGYSANGETDKRTLESPDITGLLKMYP